MVTIEVKTKKHKISFGREAMSGGVITTCPRCHKKVQGFPRTFSFEVIRDSDGYGYERVLYIKCRHCDYQIFLP